MGKDVIWELAGVTKVYPGVVANKDVSLKIKKGEIHGLLGENGSGKSTLIGLLSGVTQPSAGEIRQNGQIANLRSPSDARVAGTATVFQEFSLVPQLSVAENLFMGQTLPKNRLGLVDHAQVRTNAADLLERLGLADLIPITVRIEALSVAQQQLVEIAKAIAVGGNLLILDEPTASLGSKEIGVLHDLLRRLKANGTAILYVSHRLEEVVEIVDCATILKDGQVVSSASETPLDVASIVARMIGADPSDFFRPESHATDEVVMSVRNLSAPGVRSASFDLRRGEVLGIAGLLGAGRTELLRALYGLSVPTAGSIAVDGRPHRPDSPAEGIRAGFGFVPENRKTDGLFFNLRSPANTTIAALEDISAGGWFVSRNRELAGFEKLRSMFQMPARATNASPHGLSGGNQQKLVLGRWLFAQSRILLMDEPTQGVDVGAKASIYDLMRKLTLEGRSILLVSSDNEELLALSDRIMIIGGGRVVEICEGAFLNEHLLAAKIAATSRLDRMSERAAP